MSDKVVKAIAYIVAVVLAVCCLYPFLYILAISLNHPSEAAKGGIYLLPRQISLENYKQVFVNPKLAGAIGVTVFRLFFGTFFSVLLEAMFAYSLAQKSLRGRKLLNWLVIIPMFFSGGIIPTFLVLQKLHLTNNLMTYVIPVLYNSFHIILFRTFFVGIPASLSEAARIDGAGQFRIFVRIVLPVSLPSIAAITLFTGVYHWNDWFIGTTYIFDSNLWTLQNLLYSIMNSSGVAAMKQAMSVGLSGNKMKVTVESLKMAMIIVTVLPIVMIYPFLQRYFISGMMVGSLKE